MAIDLVCRLLDYTPATRLTPLEACAHAFFDELRDPDTRLPNGSLPPLFNFSQQGKENKIEGNSMIKPLEYFSFRISHQSVAQFSADSYAFARSTKFSDRWC